jgi:hypothetical protein
MGRHMHECVRPYICLEIYIDENGIWKSPMGHVCILNACTYTKMIFMSGFWRASRNIKVVFKTSGLDVRLNMEFHLGMQRNYYVLTWYVIQHAKYVWTWTKNFVHEYVLMTTLMHECTLVHTYTGFVSKKQNIMHFMLNIYIYEGPQVSSTTMFIHLQIICTYIYTNIQIPAHDMPSIGIWDPSNNRSLIYM